MFGSGAGATPIYAPTRVDRDGASRWDDECDLLVVGFGAAGAAAAIEGAHAGADVIVTDRFDGGGASAKSGGVVYCGGGTRHQKTAGYNDTPAAMFDYLSKEVGDAVSADTLRDFCDHSVEMLEWLEAQGVEFDSTVPLHKTSYPADGYYLYFSGNEAVKEYAGSAPPAPRGHRVKGSGLSGANLFGALRKSVGASGARVMTETTARRLIVDSDGAVIGVELWHLPQGSRAARQHQRLNRWVERTSYASAGISDMFRRRALAVELAAARPIRVHARRGVVLSTGGFIYNREMLKRHAPKYLRNFRLGTSGCDGSGIRLGQSVGGECARLERVSAWRFINPPLAWARGMIVDTTGRRFCNEEVYGARLGLEMCEHHDGNAWLVIDSTIRRDAVREALFGGLWGFQSVPAIMLTFAGAKRGRSIDDLARRMRADPVALRASWESYNRAAANGADPLGKSRDLLAALDAMPLCALDISVDKQVFPCAAITLGGLVVDEATGNVKRADGSAIAGLYAAGRAAVGVASNNYVSGLALADCIWSGRRVGRSATVNLASQTRRAEATA
ncbi:MAG TPA: FAD-binding protein [Candidatus Binataceae bacterium]|nr:FAD-binding protein [Candidatus Binataceae bacterium]